DEPGIVVAFERPAAVAARPGAEGLLHRPGPHLLAVAVVASQHLRVPHPQIADPVAEPAAAGQLWRRDSPAVPDPVGGHPGWLVERLPLQRAHRASVTGEAALRLLVEDQRWG